MADPLDFDAEPLVFGYCWTKPEKTMIYFGDDLVENLPPRSTIVGPERNQQSSQPPALESCPLEVLHLVFKYLDPQSLARLRRASTSTSEIVASFPAYLHLTRHASQALKALTRTRMIQDCNISRLYRILQTSQCSYCDHYGPYLYLLQCTRCCYNCLVQSERLVSIPLNKAKRILKSAGLPQRVSARLMTVPGTYNLEEKAWKKRLWLVSWDEIRSQVRTHNTSIYCGKPMGPTSQPTLHDVRGEDLHLDKMRFQFHASVAFPYLCHVEGSVYLEHGLWCRGCAFNWRFVRPSAEYAENDRLYKLKNAAYSNQNFAEHLEVCLGVKRLKLLRLKFRGPPDFESWRGGIPLSSTELTALNSHMASRGQGAMSSVSSTELEL